MIFLYISNSYVKKYINNLWIHQTSYAEMNIKSFFFVNSVMIWLPPKSLHWEKYIEWSSFITSQIIHLFLVLWYKGSKFNVTLQIKIYFFLQNYILKYAYSLAMWKVEWDFSFNIKECNIIIRKWDLDRYTLNFHNLFSRCFPW